MPKSQRVSQLWRLCWGVIAGFGVMLSLLACKPSRPTAGVFPIKVIVLTSDQAGIPNVSVQINGKEIGKTDKYGTFVGTHKGKVGEYVRIKVVGSGKDNFFVFKKPLKMRKTQRGWIPVEIKVNAFLRPTSEGPDSGVADATGGGTGDTAGGGTGDTAGGGGTGDTAGGSGDTAGGTAGGAGDKPKVADRGTPSGGGSGDKPKVADRGAPAGGGTGDNPKVADRGTPSGGGSGDTAGGGSGDSTPPPPVARPSGKYEITVRSNAANTRVYCRGCRRSYLGRIPDAGGALVYSHRDRRATPRALKFSFRISGRARYAYKGARMKKTLELSTDREKYEVSADFEKKPPYKISVSANVGGVKVYLGRKMEGEITDPSQPFVAEYTNYRSRGVRVTLRPSDRKVRPRRIRKYVRFKRGEYNYSVEASFKAPERPKPVARRDPNPPMPGIGLNPSDPGLRTPPPSPTPAASSGIYKITITSNAAGINVYRGRRKLGFIPDAGGSLVYTHKDKRSKPWALVLRFRAKDRYAYTERQKTMRVPLEVGRANYQVEVSFDKRKPLRFSLKSNVPGVTVRFNGRKVGAIKAAGQPLVHEYSGRPIRRATIDFRSPNPRLFRPKRVRRRVRIEKGRSEYEVTGNFTEFDPGTKVVLKPRCFRRKRGRRRVVELRANKGTRFLLKGDCDEPLAKAGKSGRIRVSMPVGTFQRVWATSGSGKRQKVFEVTRGGGPQIVAFRAVGRRCQLKRIQKKIINKIPLEEEEVNCLKKVKRGNKQYFSSQLFLARFYCQQKARNNGFRILNMLGSKARNRFNPYRTLQLGIEFGRCKKYRAAVRFLKFTEQRINRFSAADRTQNRISLYRAMSTIYEQLYYRRKNSIDLTRALKSAERLAELVPSGQKPAAKKEVSRLKKKISQKGGLDD